MEKKLICCSFFGTQTPAHVTHITINKKFEIGKPWWKAKQLINNWHIVLACHHNFWILSKNYDGVGRGGYINTLCLVSLGNLIDLGLDFDFNYDGVSF